MAARTQRKVIYVKEDKLCMRYEKVEEVVAVVLSAILILTVVLAILASAPPSEHGVVTALMR